MSSACLRFRTTFNPSNVKHLFSNESFDVAESRQSAHPELSAKKFLSHVEVDPLRFVARFSLRLVLAFFRYETFSPGNSCALKGGKILLRVDAPCRRMVACLGATESPDVGVSRHYIAIFPFLYCAHQSALTQGETRAGNTG